MADHFGVEIDGLKEFRRELRRAEQASPRDLTKAIRAAGKPPLERARALTPVRSGDLRAGWRVRASGSTGSLANVEPYAGGVVWGKRGKWKGFRKYGGTPRFAGQAIDDTADEIQEIITRNLEEILTAYGWFRGR